MGKESLKSHEELIIYQMAFEAAMKIFNLSKTFPVEERYSLTDQIRRSSRSVCANLAEAWRKRRYEAAFKAKLSDCEAEAAETQVWLKIEEGPRAGFPRKGTPDDAVKCQYLDLEQGRELYGIYNQVLSGLVNIINHPHRWVIGK
ncbi:MAG: four helix bundle protein [Cyanobacteria bacterium]|jgi:four helix bundle protein|nr:four helix bundle protein [Cyanobacteria bacterium GSL.Bin1]